MPPMNQMPFSLVDMLGRVLPPIRVVDVGAMVIRGDARPYDPLVKRGIASVVGFEPVKAECDRVNAMGRKGHTCLPYFIGDGTERTFYQCAATQTSSLYEPNMGLLKRFNELAEATTPVANERVQTRRLDDVPEIAGMDFLKVDVQGAEVDVFRGGERLLQETVMVQTEVCFGPMYKDQPLFAEIDQELRRQGFLFHCFTSICGRAFKPLAPGRGPGFEFRQLLWADAVYVKDYTRLGALSPEQLLRLAAMVNDLLMSPDLAALALQHHDAKKGGDLWSAFMRRLIKTVPERPELE